MLQVCPQLILSGHLYHSVPSHIPPQLRLPWVPLRADPHRVLSTAIKLCGQGALTWLRGRYIDAREGQNPTNPALLPVRAGRGRSRPDRPQPPLEPSRAFRALSLPRRGAPERRCPLTALSHPRRGTPWGSGAGLPLRALSRSWSLQSPQPPPPRGSGAGLSPQSPQPPLPRGSGAGLSPQGCPPCRTAGLGGHRHLGTATRLHQGLAAPHYPQGNVLRVLQALLLLRPAARQFGSPCLWVTLGFCFPFIMCHLRFQCQPQ